jgi:hypothetical protein
VYDKGSATKTAYQWGFSFSDSDGFLDRVIYQVFVEDAFNTTLSFTEIELRQEELRELQPYFHGAVDRMVEKAKGEPARALIALPIVDGGNGDETGNCGMTRDKPPVGEDGYIPPVPSARAATDYTMRVIRHGSGSIHAANVAFWD